MTEGVRWISTLVKNSLKALTDLFNIYGSKHEKNMYFAKIRVNDLRNRTADFGVKNRGNSARIGVVGIFGKMVRYNESLKLILS